MCMHVKIDAEALELYLETQKRRTNAIKHALAFKGSLNGAEAADLAAKTRKIWANWR